MDLEFTPVARPGVHLSDRKASLEALLHDLPETDRNLLDFRISDGRDRLGDNAGAKHLFKNADHKAPE
jgi:hypothetical protein